MRLWSLHPRYLDGKGLGGLWREGLLARHCLLGLTRGYVHHPQLRRFRAHASPVEALDAYLGVVWEEACARGYRLDGTKLGNRLVTVAAIPLHRGQLDFEIGHLARKLRERDPVRAADLEAA